MYVYLGQQKLRGRAQCAACGCAAVPRRPGDSALWHLDISTVGPATPRDWMGQQRPKESGTGVAEDVNDPQSLQFDSIWGMFRGHKTLPTWILVQVWPCSRSFCGPPWHAIAMLSPGTTEGSSEHWLLAGWPARTILCRPGSIVFRWTFWTRGAQRSLFAPWHVAWCYYMIYFYYFFQSSYMITCRCSICSFSSCMFQTIYCVQTTCTPVPCRTSAIRTIPGGQNRVPWNDAQSFE